MQNTQIPTRGQLCLRLIRYVAPYWDAVILGVISMIAMAASVPMLVALVQPMLDGAIAGKNLELMQLVLLGIISLFAVRAVAGHIGAYAVNGLGSKLVLDLQVEMFAKLLTLPAPYCASHESGSLVSGIASDTEQVARTFTDVITVAVKDVLVVLGLLGWMLYLDWRLALLALLMASAMLLITRLVTVRLQKMAMEAQQTMGSLNQVLEDAIENYQVVKLHGGEQYENQRMREKAEEAHRLAKRRMAMASLRVPLIQIAAAGALAVIVYVTAQQAFADEITAGSFVSFMAAMLMLISPVKRIAGLKEVVRHGLGAVESVFSLLDQEPELDMGTIIVERARGELRFEQVHFHHDQEKSFEGGSKANPGPGGQQGIGACSALLGITLTIQPGEMVALVGFSGSTAVLASLVPRFINPASGKILLDGHDLRSLKLASLRANIALVSSKTTLFNDTIAANIAYGALGRATEATITAAAQAAHATEFIRKMPQGLQTLVGEHGVNLTGGQRLRVAIARALIKNSPILILDEATEKIDIESAHHVQAALDAVVQERTTLVIADRLATMEKADRVVLLGRGGAVEIGSHRELLARGGAYAKLARALYAQKDVMARNSESSLG
ncbi:ATP-binding cassette, subfamily B, MsbA [Nitrosospira sp. Nsp18]|uniref:ABC transporter transmembrane domain-containing protein n=1 Tax=Nitrosospira sp. Nsp18 TaxID=1855334 RepID=UPI000884A9C8|nr:ABC transporter transmembrane domain-containing protein [Nitrosospira sp. Nsp18]SDA11524.1 ATP-binding cassette, subfamily B, MsbA [Nitrosospira sp. Nsp18]